MTFLPFSLEDGAIQVNDEASVEVVIDRGEAVGLVMTKREALAFAKALRQAARSAKKSKVE